MAAEPEPGGAADAGIVEAGPPVALASEAPTQDAEWLDRLCPYLLSEDGTWRSTQPDPAHRCTAQDPPGTLPSAFQERFCLTDRHVRCEMFKYAQEMRAAALDQEGTPMESVPGGGAAPSASGVPLPVGVGQVTAASGAGDRNRALLIGGALVVGAVLLFFVLLILGGGGDEPGGAAGASASPGPGQVAPATPALTVATTSTPTLTPDSTPEGAVSPAPVATERIARYRVQEGEALLKIANNFGVTRRRIKSANEGMEDKTPFVVTGEVINVPVSPDVPEAEITALPGFIEFIEEAS